MNKEFIVDLECDGLIEDATKIHVMSFGWVNNEGKFIVKSTTDYDVMRKFFLNEENTAIGHNFNLYDVLVAEKLLKIKAKCKIIDTLGLSWYLQPARNEHSIESYAQDYGEHKVEIEDWKNLPVEKYIERCEKDIYLQYKLWLDQKAHLAKIYDNNEANIKRFIDYIAFKLDCVKEQQYLGLEFDEASAIETLRKLTEEKGVKIKAIEAAMPKVEVMATKSMPKKMYNSKSELSALGRAWNDFLIEQGLPITHTRDVKFVKGYEEPNANSHDQIKKWLFSLGWNPEHFKFNRNKKTGEIKQVPQVGSKAKDGTLCPSVLRLVEKAPGLAELNGLSIINHRITVFEGMLRDQRNGKLYQNMAGFTNTMRLQHRVLVNLPKPGVPYGREIRGCLLSDKGHVFCGADLSSLEDKTKQHYMFEYDPEYVKEMNIPGFDPHLDLAIRAKMLTVEQSDLYKRLDKEKELNIEEKVAYAGLKKVRHKAKTTNYAATYGAGGPKIAQAAEIPLQEGNQLHRAYWDRNWAIRKIAENALVKTIDGQMWIYNPISRFWYSLRYEKDRFSTLNQSTGVFVFDTWVAFVRKQGIQIAYQSHDEILYNVPENEQDKNTEKVNKAIQLVNNMLKLNIQIECGIKYGRSYTEVH